MASSTTFNPYSKEGKGSEHTDKAKDAGNEALNKTKEAGKDVMGKAKEAGSEALSKVKDAGSEALSKVKDASTDAMGKAREAAGAVGEMATHAASAVGQKADDLTSTAGHEIRGWGDNLSQHSPREGIAGAASQAVADTIKGGGRYLEEAKLSGMAQDVEQIVKSHPIPSLLICFGVAFCLGRALKD